MKKSLFTVYIFSKLNTRRFFRDRVALFFTIAFPLIFLFVFGGIFGKSTDLSFRVAVINESSSQYSKNTVNDFENNKVFNISPNISNLEQAKEKMTRGELDAALILPKNFGQLQGTTPTGNLQVYYTQNNEQAAQTLTSIIDAQLIGLNAQFMDVNPPFVAEAKPLNEKQLSRFDYTFAGLLGFAIVGLGIFGPINVFPELKKLGVLRRLHTTPLKVWQYFLSTATSQTVIGLFTMAILFAVAIAVFDLEVVGNYLALIFFLSLSIVTILGIGLAVGGWAKNERQAAPLANIIVFPMLFLSGTFFPRFIMPDWLQSVSTFLPLTAVIDGIRLIATEGKTLVEIAPQVGLLSIWAVIIYLIAFRIFRWE